MLVEMLRRIGGTRDGREWPGPGETIDVPAAEADMLIAARHATLAEGSHDEESATPSDDTPAENGDETPAEVGALSDVPSLAGDVVDWIGDDADRARLAAEVEAARGEARKSVLAAIAAVLGETEG